MNTTDITLSTQLAALAETIRDDIDRAERLGRGTIDAYVASHYAERLDALAKQAKREVCS